MLPLSHKGNYRDIEDGRQTLLFTMWFELRKLMGFQFLFTLLALAGGTYVLTLANVDFEAANLYDILLMAAYFYRVQEVISILFLYFDAQERILQLMGLYFLGTLVLGLGGIALFGESSYGCTFFLSSGLALFYGLHSLDHFADRLNYYIFCGQPMFYRPRVSFMTHLRDKLYGVKESQKGGSL